MERTIEIVRLPGVTSYGQAMDMQDRRRAAVEKGEAGNALFVLEHGPVITLGRNSHRDNVLRSPELLSEMGIELCETNRGGDVTYHGPGQMVTYPVLDLRQWQTSLRWYLRTLEETLIRLLARYDLPAERVEGLTGVWVNGAKIAAIGIAAHNWVTFHGVALNVRPDMTHFGLIIPCGIADKPVTSLHEILGWSPPMDEVMNAFEQEFLECFGPFGPRNHS